MSKPLALKRLPFDAGCHGPAASVGLLVLRLGSGGMLAVQHGWGKAMDFSSLSSGFPDPLGIGHEASLAMALFGELVCGALVALGIGTRAAAVPAAITMAVAVFLHHADDPFKVKELAVMYMIPFVVLMLTGAGRYSVDRLISSRGA